MNKTIVLRAKKVRAYIIANPGCTKDDIYAAHPGEMLTGGFEMLTRHGMARYEGGGKKGPARWFATESPTDNREPIREDDHKP